MAGTGASSPYIKEEPEDQYFSSHGQRFMSGSHQAGFNMPQQHFNQFGNHGGSINPSDLTMGNGMNIPNGGYGSSFHQSNFPQASNTNGNFAKGISTLNDDELLDSLVPMNNDSHGGHQGMGGHDFGLDFDFAPGMYSAQNGLTIDPSMNGYSNTPDGDPIQSPFVHNFNQAQFRHMQQQNNFGSSLQSPNSYSNSPLQGSDLQSGSMDANFAKQRPRLAQVMQGRKSSNARSPLTPKTPAISSLSLAEPASFPAQPIRTQSHRHQKTLSGQWDQTPSSMTSFPGSGFSSPVQGGHPNAQISDILKGASMPAKLGHSQTASTPALQSQEMKRRRRRESHNLVERRRRDNINERIHELSHLVPLHRLEDEKVRKALQNNSPLSPTLAGLSVPPSGSPPQATSGLAGPGARRATAGNITTGIPIEEKDKGPNKGDILNGAVSWTRDLMWMLHLKLQQQEDLANIIAELGGTFPFEQTEDERRMHTELMDAMLKNDGATFQYSRAPGTGLRVPKHTDVKGDVLSASHNAADDSLSPENPSTGGNDATGMGGPGQYWSGHNSGGSGAGSISFKEEDEYVMDLN